jgi:hypothetical protein
MDRKSLKRKSTKLALDLYSTEAPRESPTELDAMAYGVMLSHNGKSQLVESLTVAPYGISQDEFDTSAIMDFTNLKTWMFERPVQEWQRQSCQHDVLETAQHSDYKDESYIQLMKQLTDNPSSRSLKAGWELLYAMTTTAPPSPVVAEFLRVFARKQKAILLASDNAEITDWAERDTELVFEALAGKSAWKPVEATLWEGLHWLVG